jgi:ABC-type polysaccharide/polyol phosphate transport system ATPase subunit
MINADMNTDRDEVIRLENVSVHYRLPGERIHTFKEYAIRMLQGKIQYVNFHALNDVSLQIFRGELFGLIGKNGAGKSTLLKVISRVLVPPQGHVWIKGRVTPMLGLGAGFHPELTGRENIFLNGTLLGHSHREIKAHMDEIIEFSELDNFIDAPLRTYSSGMNARLGFACATTWQPDILILDEVLAVGDEAFRQKCEQRMLSFRNGQTTSLLVSHSMEAILSICKRVAWLDHGVIRMIGPTSEVVAAYRQAQGIRVPQTGN